MKKTMTAYDIANELLADEFAAWTRAGAFALADRLLEYEEETGEEMDFDRVAIRCEWDEYATEADLYSAYKCPALDRAVEGLEGEEWNEAVLGWIDDRTERINIPSNGGFIIRAF